MARSTMIKFVSTAAPGQARMTNHAIAALGEILRRYSSLPYDQAWSMASAFYTDLDMLALE